MSAIDPFVLARIQFAANISFHILFPTITIALGWVLFFFKLRFAVTGNDMWMAAYRFWVKIFALSFGMGVVSGITMSFQFGTNWPGFMERVGNIAGPLLGYEVLTAFFMEAVFIGIMLFGYSRVGNRWHTVATGLVAFGTTLSAFWIIVLNSWMHTPAGFEIIEGVAHATDWLAIVFNPSMPYRLIHMLLASGLTVAFLIAGISAYRWLIGQRGAEVVQQLRFGLIMGALLIPIQIYTGDLHGLNTLEHQPAKVAAMEANWQTGSNVPLVLFAVPNEDTRSNDFEVSVANGASLILTHHADGVVPGLNDFEGAHPPVKPVFYGFRIMVGTGFAMLAVSWLGMAYIWRRRKTTTLPPFPKLLLWALVPMTFSGWLATLSGWYVTEIGRQPWLVTGVLSTKEAVADIPVAFLGLSLGTYLLIYALLLSAFIWVLFHLARSGGQARTEEGSKARDYLNPIPASFSAE